MIDRLAALPGVSGVAVAVRIPLASRAGSKFEMQLQAADDDGRPTVASATDMASADYFHVMGIPLHAGRSFRPGDLRATPAVVVSERLAMNLFGTTNVVGRRIRRPASGGDSAIAFTVVGVAGDVNWECIEDG